MTTDMPAYDRPRFSRRAKVLTGISAGVAGLAILGAVTSGGSKPAPRPAAPAAAVTPAAVSCRAQARGWLAGPGDAALQAVSADDRQISADAGNGDLAAVEADGAQLETDAGNAAALPVPACMDPSGDYTMAMTAYQNAGADVAAGDLGDAAAELQAGTAYVNDLAAAVNGS